MRPVATLFNRDLTSPGLKNLSGDFCEGPTLSSFLRICYLCHLSVHTSLYVLSPLDHVCPTPSLIPVTYLIASLIMPLATVQWHLVETLTPWMAVKNINNQGHYSWWLPKDSPEVETAHLIEQWTNHKVTCRNLKRKSLGFWKPLKKRVRSSFGHICISVAIRKFVSRFLAWLLIMLALFPKVVYTNYIVQHANVAWSDIYNLAGLANNCSYLLTEQPGLPDPVSSEAVLFKELML